MAETEYEYTTAVITLTDLLQEGQACWELGQLVLLMAVHGRRAC